MKPNTNNNNNTSTSNRNSNNSNTQGHNYQQGSQHHDRRRQQQQQHQQQNRPQQQQQQTQSNEQSHYQQYQRDRSGQRNQHPDSSMGRDTSMGHSANQSNLGAVRFTPGTSTRDLPPIETKADSSKKFTGRCRLFIGNLAHNTTEEKLKNLFEPFGEVGEVFLGPKSAFAFIKMDTRQSAEAARDALDCSIYENRTLRVRLAAHSAAIRIKHLSPHVTNELLAYAFRYFGEVERAVIVVDDKGRSIGEGIVEFSRKQSALYAIKRCQQECFMLTASPKPVLVELYDQHDEDEGLPEKSVNRNSIEYKEQRDVGPRFAEQGTFEHDFGLRWKELYEVEKQKRDRLEQEIQEARKKLQDQIEYSRLEHNEMQLRSQLQQLEDNRMKLRQMKEQEVSDAQQQEDRRRQQDMLIRQREEEILRRQQLSDPTSLGMNLNMNMNLNQQESTLRMQASALQDILNNQDYDDSNDANHTQQKSQATGSQVGPETETNMQGGHQINMMASQLASQPRTFADAAMMGMSHQSYIPVQQMGMHPSAQNPQMNQPNMFTSFMQPQQQMQLPIDATNLVQVQTYPMMAQQQQAVPSNQGRQQKFSRPHNGGNNIVLQSGGSARPRKRGKF